MCQWKDPDPELTVDSLPLHTTFPRYRTEQSFTSLTRYALGRYPDETLPIAVIVADDKPEFLIETSLTTPMLAIPQIRPKSENAITIAPRTYAVTPGPV
jgi:hypothetical protein